MYPRKFIPTNRPYRILKKKSNILTIIQHLTQYSHKLTEKELQTAAVRPISRFIFTT